MEHSYFWHGQDKGKGKGKSKGKNAGKNGGRPQDKDSLVAWDSLMDFQGAQSQKEDHEQAIKLSSSCSLAKERAKAKQR